MYGIIEILLLTHLKVRYYTIGKWSKKTWCWHFKRYSIVEWRNSKSRWYILAETNIRNNWAVVPRKRRCFHPTALLISQLQRRKVNLWNSNGSATIIVKTFFYSNWTIATFVLKIFHIHRTHDGKEACWKKSCISFQEKSRSCDCCSQLCCARKRLQTSQTETRKHFKAWKELAKAQTVSRTSLFLI